MREWLARLRDWLRRDTLDRELSEELRFHREQLERDARSEGLPADEAHYLATRRLGNVTLVREEARVRWSWLDRFQQDVRYALRGLRRSPRPFGESRSTDYPDCTEKKQQQSAAESV